jgi:hypothetical protein
LTEVQVWWFSDKTKKEEMVYARQLDRDQRASLLGRIFNYQDWSELKSLIEKHEGQPVSYVCSGVRVSGQATRVNLLVKGKSK